MTTRHVVLTTYGEPPSAAFGPQLRYSWRLLVELTRTVAPIPKPALPPIALFRSIRRSASWSWERYGSPLEKLSRAQAEALARTLASRAPETTWRVCAAYEFRNPGVSDILEPLDAKTIVDVIPMYVADSAFTHALSRDAAFAADRSSNASPGASTDTPADTFADTSAGRAPRTSSVTKSGPAVRVLPALSETRLAKISADHILDELTRRDIVPDRNWGLLLTAHGAPLEPPDALETGRAATEGIGRAIIDHLQPHFGAIRIGWLNHVRGGPWTQPAAVDALREMMASGTRKVAYYPFGFLADNAETQLEGLQILRPALRAGLDEAIHLPCLNSSPPLIEALADQILAPAPREAKSAQLA